MNTILFFQQKLQQHRKYDKLSLSTVTFTMTLIIMFKTSIFPVNSLVRNKSMVGSLAIRSNAWLSHHFLTISNDSNKKIRTVASLSSSSWMEKNKRFESTAKSSKFDFPKSSQRNRRNGDSSNTTKQGSIPSGVVISDETSSEHRSLSFKEDFRGTRVFVQNIPLHASWQDLKDHFRIAGNVVFASVSRNSVDGTSKGCGVVQFETVSEAKHAIATMRNHPMISDTGDSMQLYVREDRQDQPASLKENDPYAPFKNQRMGGGSGVLRSERMNKKWSCADEDADNTLDHSAKEQIMAILRARDAARFRRNYEASDTMREELKKKFNVHIDDRTFLWWINNPNKPISENRSSADAARSSAWRQIPSTPENDLCVDADLVNALLLQRDIARREKDFRTADKLLEQATNAPDGENLTLRIHDESRTWRVWASAPPPRQRTFSSRSKSDNYGDTDDKKKDEVEKTSTGTDELVMEKCIALVSKFDPEKVEEIRELLKTFPDRQETILRKLIQRYNSKM